MKLLRESAPELFTSCEDVVMFDDALRSLVDGMLDVMYTHNGVGLAAPQVGVLSRIVIVDPSAGERAIDMTVMCNPRTVKMSSDSDVAEEACLSFPGLVVEVYRALSIEVEYYDVMGNESRKTFDGFAARIVQHEIDHLDGVTLLRHAEHVKQERIAL